MKKVVFGFVLIAGSFLLNSCGKNETGCSPTPVENEKAALIAYCQANNINYTEHISGLLYEIVSPGTGPSPVATSTVSVVYTGKHFDNTNFDARATPYTTALSGFIDGWKIGLMLIKKGGRIKLIVPSALAYSCTGRTLSDGTVAIKPNEPLFFDVTLSDVQ